MSTRSVIRTATATTALHHLGRAAERSVQESAADARRTPRSSRALHAARTARVALERAGL